MSNTALAFLLTQLTGATSSGLDPPDRSPSIQHRASAHKARGPRPHHTSCSSYCAKPRCCTQVRLGHTQVCVSIFSITTFIVCMVDNPKGRLIDLVVLTLFFSPMFFVFQSGNRWCSQQSNLLLNGRNRRDGDHLLSLHCLMCRQPPQRTKHDEANRWI